MPRDLPNRPPHLTEEEAKLAAKLVGRLKPRTTAQGVTWTLDLRHRAFGLRDRITCYEPNRPGWPEHGRPTDSEAVAESWIYADGGYAQWLARELRLSGPSTSDKRHVADEVERYIKHLLRTLGPDHPTTVNRSSTLRKHVTPSIGTVSLRALNRITVREMLEGVVVTKRSGPRRFAAKPALRTLENIYDALVAVWNFVHPDESCPYHRVQLQDTSKQRDRREKIISGDVDKVLDDWTWDPSEIEDILLTAMWYDHHVASMPNHRETYIPLTAEAIAVLFGTGMRVSEEARWQWRQLREAREALIVPGTKTENALRVAPLQVTLRPWIQRLREQARRRKRDGAEDNVLAMRANGPNVEGTTADQIIERVSKVLWLSGHKHEQQATHGFRATHFTMGKLRSNLIDMPSLKTYLGHEQAHGGATEAYIDRHKIELVLREMQPSHRTYIELPSPDEILRRLPDYVPPGMRGKRSLEEAWEERRREAECDLIARGAVEIPNFPREGTRQRGAGARRALTGGPVR